VQHESQHAISGLDVSPTKETIQIQGQAVIFNPAGSAKHSQNVPQTELDRQINQCEKQRCQRRQNENHDGCQQDFATRGPDDLGYLGADLLDKLDRVGGGHGCIFSVWIKGSLTRIARAFQGPATECAHAAEPLGCDDPVKLAGAAGFEPATYGFGDRRSTS